MLNFTEVFDVMQVEPATGSSVWTVLTGTRTALERDGHMVDPNAMACCPIEWLDERGYLDAELARQHPRPWGI
ncbi:hypothetical protein [Bradyrhizobium sp. Arg816]|uniref:hypothetical protein n=1 Tax=Bradyrhizobium sp. Arg816 TaxID=2998491 RepID=UPI00249F0012|nr:hypothetical protein [Bradyrhizobium sp. Arg816]MDI3567520.1 hypothetical protein [Bradyrhizobium sp. Arg816]